MKNKNGTTEQKDANITQSPNLPKVEKICPTCGRSNYNWIDVKIDIDPEDWKDDDA